MSCLCSSSSPPGGPFLGLLHKAESNSANMRLYRNRTRGLRCASSFLLTGGHSIPSRPDGLNLVHSLFSFHSTFPESLNHHPRPSLRPDSIAHTASRLAQGQRSTSTSLGNLVVQFRPYLQILCLYIAVLMCAELQITNLQLVWTIPTNF